MNATSGFSVGDKVYFGRPNGEQTLGEVVKVNGKKLKVKQLESRGSLRERPVGTIWGVPPSLCAKAATGTKPNAASFAPADFVIAKPVSNLEDAASFAPKATKLGLPADCLGKWITLNRTTKLQIVGLKPSRPQYPVSVQGVQGGKYKLDVATVRSGLNRDAK